MQTGLWGQAEAILRTVLTSLDTVTFVLCQLTWRGKDGPAPYKFLYVRNDDCRRELGNTAEAKVISAGK